MPKRLPSCWRPGHHPSHSFQDPPLRPVARAQPALKLPSQKRELRPRLPNRTRPGLLQGHPGPARPALHRCPNPPWRAAATGPWPNLPLPTEHQPEERREQERRNFRMIPNRNPMLPVHQNLSLQRQGQAQRHVERWRGALPKPAREAREQRRAWRWDDWAKLRQHWKRRPAAGWEDRPIPPWAQPEPWVGRRRHWNRSSVWRCATSRCSQGNGCAPG